MAIFALERVGNTERHDRRRELLYTPVRRPFNHSSTRIVCLYFSIYTALCLASGTEDRFVQGQYCMTQSGMLPLFYQSWRRLKMASVQPLPPLRFLATLLVLHMPVQRFHKVQYSTVSPTSDQKIAAFTHTVEADRF